MEDFRNRSTSGDDVDKSISLDEKDNGVMWCESMGVGGRVLEILTMIIWMLVGYVLTVV